MLHLSIITRIGWVCAITESRAPKAASKVEIEVIWTKVFHLIKAFWNCPHKLYKLKNNLGLASLKI